MTVPGLGPAQAPEAPSTVATPPPTTAPPASLASPTSVTRADDPATVVGPAGGADTQPDPESPADRSPSSLAGVEVLFGIAGVALIGLAIRRQRQRRRGAAHDRRPTRRPAR
jgi:hypothetical protein